MSLRILAVIVVLLAAPVFARDAARVFYFGNSLTAGSMPAWQPELARSLGKTWETHAWLGAGWQLWQHREQIAANRELFSAASRGDLTIDPKATKSVAAHLRAFQDPTWDTVVLQLFAPYLTEITSAKWNQKLTAEKDAGDLGAAIDLIRWRLAIAPHTRVFVYQVWPMMDPGEPREGKRGAEFPQRERFDYAARWNQPYDPVASPKDQARRPWRSRAFSEQVFAGLQREFPALWQSGRLRMIPAGELLAALDAVFRERPELGVADIRDFYTDVQHLRAGLPRYTIAALMFAAIFETSPRGLDWNRYNDFARYGPDPSHDHTPLLEITPQRVEVVHAAIENLTARHPYLSGPR